MTKEQRQRIFEKFGGKCAYTGKSLGNDWQVDHMISKREHSIMMTDSNAFENLMPCLKIVNHYKRGLYFDRWRHRVSVLHLRLGKLPKKTRSPRAQKLKEYLFEVAESFDITPEKPFNGNFYFELFKGGEKQ